MEFNTTRFTKLDITEYFTMLCVSHFKEIIFNACFYNIMILLAQTTKFIDILESKKSKEKKKIYQNNEV